MKTSNHSLLVKKVTLLISLATRPAQTATKGPEANASPSLPSSNFAPLKFSEKLYILVYLAYFVPLQKNVQLPQGCRPKKEVGWLYSKPAQSSEWRGNAFWTGGRAEKIKCNFVLPQNCQVYRDSGGSGSGNLAILGDLLPKNLFLGMFKLKFCLKIVKTCSLLYVST